MGAKIYPQSRQINEEFEKLEFVDGDINYDQIEADAKGQTIEDLSREDQVLFGFPEGSVDEFYEIQNEGHA